MVGARFVRSAALAGAACAAVLGAPVRADDAPCPAVWPPRPTDQTVSLLEPEGLLSLRNIAQPAAGLNATSPLAISPDGRQLAFFVTQPVLEVNDICESLVVLDVAAPDAGKVIDSGGVGIRSEEVLRGARYQSGYFDLNIPVWSPDGTTLVYRKRVSGRTQAWLARLDGTPARQLSHADHDVEAVAWSVDGARVLFTIRPGRAAFFAAREAEARKGFLYDSRVVPLFSPEPQLPADLPEQVMAIPVKGGAAVPATGKDRARFRPPATQSMNDVIPARRTDGLVAGAGPVDSTYLSPHRVWVETPAGRQIDCRNPACAGFLRGVWWQGSEVMFLKRDGWYREDSVIQAWSPHAGAVRTLLRSRERISHCVGSQAGVLCLAEDSRRPRRIVALDPANGDRREFFDPNPEADIAALPQVKRLRWKNELGYEAWADLVLPPGAPPPAGWPMVIVQYRSDGFLRGGTGDEYPIFPLAARGIAVFSYQRPDLFATHRSPADDIPAVVAAIHRNWSDRRSTHDSLMKGLDLALSQGGLDPARIGITGLSDGSTTARFALINQSRFVAVSLGSCCLEPFSMMALGGLAQAEWFRQMGFPDASRPDPEFWRPGSLALNADRINTPVLLQLPDAEYIMGLETFTALREHGKPVDLYVFPDEHHVKWQPVHRAAIYERNLDWFSFWLQGRVDPDPAKAEQYRRWTEMKIVQASGPSVP